MKQTVVYIHGKGGSIQEADHYRSIFEGYDVIGFDYQSDNPWDAKNEFNTYMNDLCKEKGKIILIANSIGAYFSMCSFTSDQIEKAFFISPVVDMEKLIENMMMWSNVSEDELKEKREIKTDFGETLSFDYLQYVKEHPIYWDVPTYILYGENDNLTSFETISSFSEKINAELTVMKNGEHWFHTDEQMGFLDSWIFLITSDDH